MFSKKVLSSRLLGCPSIVSSFRFSASASGNAAKSWEDIPTPDGGWLPYFGHGILLVKAPGGRKRPWKNFAKLREQYVPEGVELLRLHIPMINPKGNGRVLQIFDPADGHEVYRNEGKYPYRGEFFSVFGVLRERRPDVFGDTKGLLLEEGERWYQIRSRVQQDMMRPKSALYFVDKMNKSCDEFVDFIRRERNPDTLAVDHFLPMAHKFGLELTTMIALDTKLGCFDENPPEELKRHMKAIEVLINKMVDLITAVPVWKILPPRVSPTFRLIEDNLNIMIEFVRAKVDEAVTRIDKKELSDVQDDLSILEKLILRNGPNKPATYVMAMDIIFGGVDTTGNSMAFLLYQLSRNPEKQEKLRSEIKSFGHDNLTGEDIGKMRYFRACLQESFRIHPTVPAAARVLNQDTIIRGYKIPAGTFAMWDARVMGSDPKLFPNPERYYPERWIEDKSEIHPFAVRPFSHGPRMCIGKRFAELEILIGIAKILENFHVEWVGYGVLDPLTELVNVPDKPLKFKFTDVKK